MESMKKIIVVLLTHKEYFSIFKKVWKAVKAIETPEGYEVDKLVFTDLQKGEEMPEDMMNLIKKDEGWLETVRTPMVKFKRKLKKGHRVRGTNWTEDQAWKVKEIRNAYMEIVKKGGYEWLLNIDGDTLPPKDVLKKLLAENKKVIGGWTYNRKYGGVLINPNKIEFGQVYQVHLTGTYCLLEHKDTFKIPYSFWKDKPAVADDRKRHIDMQKEGFKIWCHPGVFSEHLDPKTGIAYRDNSHIFKL